MTRSAGVKVTWTARYFLASFLINGYFSLLADFSTTRADLHQSSHIQCRNVIITSSFHGDWYKSNNKPWNNDFLSWGLTKCSRHSGSSSGATAQSFPIRRLKLLFHYATGVFDIFCWDPIFWDLWNLDSYLGNWARFWDFKIWQKWDFAPHCCTKIAITLSIYEIQGLSFVFIPLFECLKILCWNVGSTTNLK